jgi:predicted acyltransferase
MFLAGNVLLLLGVILDMWMPINKNLWTSSYSIFMAGWALVVFACFYWLIDVKGHTAWAKPFIIYGMNAIAAYVLSGLVATLLYLITWTATNGQVVSLKGWIYDRFFVPSFSPVNASLFFAIAFDLTIFAVAWMMWKRDWFVKV